MERQPDGDSMNTDSDGGAVPGQLDNTPSSQNPIQVDSDGDGLPGPCDSFPVTPDPGDDVYDDRDPSSEEIQEDSDHDGFPNECDRCPIVPEAGLAEQIDIVCDGVGDACDTCI